MRRPVDQYREARPIVRHRGERDVLSLERPNALVPARLKRGVGKSVLHLVVDSESTDDAIGETVQNEVVLPPDLGLRTPPPIREGQRLHSELLALFLLLTPLP